MTKQADKPTGKGERTSKEATDGHPFRRTGVAVGIGSAAIVAALLYSRSGKPKKK